VGNRFQFLGNGFSFRESAENPTWYLEQLDSFSDIWFPPCFTVSSKRKHLFFDLLGNLNRENLNRDSRETSRSILSEIREITWPTGLVEAFFWYFLVYSSDTC
jgi:hypothetical protein